MSTWLKSISTVATPLGNKKFHFNHFFRLGSGKILAIIKLIVPFTQVHFISKSLVSKTSLLLPVKKTMYIKKHYILEGIAQQC